MNNNELVLFKEMIKETFRSVLKEELPKLIKEELETIKKSSAKDLKEVKLLQAHQIKELKKIGSVSSDERQALTENTKSRLGEIFNRSNKVPKTQTVSNTVASLNSDVKPGAIENILLETAYQMTPDDRMNHGIGEMDTETGWDDFPQEEFYEPTEL